MANQVSPVLSNRATSIIINAARSAVIQPGVLLERPAMYIGADNDTRSIDDGFSFIDAVGLRVRSYQDESYTIYESSEGTDGTMRLADGVANGSISEVPYQQQNPALGLIYKVLSIVLGAYGMQNRPTAGGTWASTLTADVVTWPMPYSSPVMDMERQYIHGENHQPDVALTLKFFLPISQVADLEAVVGIMFTGPAGKTTGATGIGVYYLQLNATGDAHLYEAKESTMTGSSAEWQWRHHFKWADGDKVSDAKHIIKIQSDGYFDAKAGRWRGSKITFGTSGVSSGDKYGTALNVAAYMMDLVGIPGGKAVQSASGARNHQTHASVYSVPSNEDAKTVLEAVRLDTRPDIRPIFQISKHEYPITEKTITDAPFVLPFELTADGLVTIELLANVRGSTAVDIEVYDAETDLELTGGTTTINDVHGVQKTYNSPADTRRLYCKIKATATKWESPTILSWRFHRDPITETPARTSITLPKKTNDLPEVDIDAVAIQGNADPTQVNAKVALVDFVDDLSTLRTQGLQPIEIKTEYDGVPNSTWLFYGYISNALRKRKGKDRTVDGYGVARAAGDQVLYPDKEYSHYDVTCQGEWRRLSEALAPHRYTWWDIDAGAPQKIDTIIQTLLLGAGVAIADQDLPGSELRYWNQDLMMEPGTRVGDVILSLVRDFYGGQLVYDRNAGTTGMWRVLPQKTAPYNILARFEIQTADQAKTRLTGAHSDKTMWHVSEGYGTSATTSPLGNSQTTIHTFIQGGTFTQWVEPPEGNLVYVYGMQGMMSSSSGENESRGSGPSGMSRVIVNTDSYNFLNLGALDTGYPDETHADYLGRVVPIHYPNPLLQTQAQVDFTARRIYNYACHARTHLQFRAPLILITDIDDANQTNPRPLRHYDVVEVYDEETAAYLEYLVESVAIIYHDDGIQMANYHLVRSSVMSGTSGIAVSYNRTTSAQILGRAQAQREGRSFWDPMSDWAAGMQEMKGKHIDQWLLPDWKEVQIASGLAMQNVDPTSGDFGTFAWMEGMDTLL